MNLSQWLDATSPKGAKTPKEAAAREAVRARVLAAAGTTINTLRVARARGRIGDELLYRLAEATKNEKLKIKVRDERPEP